MKNMKKQTIHLLQFENTPIYKQLQIEEALLRVSQENWCVLNSGAPLAIVMGISGKVHDLLVSRKVIENNVPVIKRFSGGGTVVVDENTLFASFIINEESVGVRCFPDQVHAWAERFYQKIFLDSDFLLRENDYVFGEHKFGGNAQYLRKGRWLHHTTFLWEYNSKHMEYLKIPSKAPKYREGRDHADFLCKLSQRIPEKKCFFDRVYAQLSENFEVKSVSLDDVVPILDQEHRKATKLLDMSLAIQNREI